MYKSTLTAIMAVLVLVAVCTPASCGRLMGDVTLVTESTITTTFPAAVRLGSALMVLAGNGDSVAAMAVSDSCKGNGPYTITGNILWISDPISLTAGRKVYVNSFNASAIPTKPHAQRPPIDDQDLNFYYYSAAQNVGYGTLGVGLEHSLYMGPGIELELDGGVTGLGGVEQRYDGSVSADYLIMNLDGKLKMKLEAGFSIYGGYRWTKSRTNDEKWDNLVDDLHGKQFIAESELDSRQMLLQGLEYGLSFGSPKKMSVSMGYIPEYRVDYGGLGIRSEPAYTTEIRFGAQSGGIRLRGLTSDGFWMADLGITIK